MLNMLSSFSLLGLSVMFILSATGQQRPNFSGTWEVKIQPSNILSKLGLERRTELVRWHEPI